LAFKQYLQDANLEWLRGNAFPPPPGQLWLSLHSSTTIDNSDEVSALVGGRIQVLAAWFSVPRWQDAVVGGTRETTNNRSLIFDLATGTVEVRTFSLWDASLGGTQFLTGDVIPDVTVVEGDPVVLLTGSLLIRVS
jgi:hypothetical protein